MKSIFFVTIILYRYFLNLTFITVDKKSHQIKTLKEISMYCKRIMINLYKRIINQLTITRCLIRASRSFVVGEAPRTYSTIFTPKPPVSFDLGESIELPSGKPPGLLGRPKEPGTCSVI